MILLHCMLYTLIIMRYRTITTSLRSSCRATLSDFIRRTFRCTSRTRGAFSPYILYHNITYILNLCTFTRREAICSVLQCPKRTMTYTCRVHMICIIFTEDAHDVNILQSYYSHYTCVRKINVKKKKKNENRGRLWLYILL